MNSKRLVAVVDDDESVRQAIDGLIRSVGLEAASVATAEEFLRSEHLHSSQCLILDLQLPGMDGLQLQQRLARHGPRIPVIILTAHGDDDARSRALGAGAVAFFQKPVASGALLGAVALALERR